jgi:hypothetical protein
MLDSQQLIITIDKRLADVRKEIASLERALSAMSKPSKAAKPASSTRTARTNGAAPAKRTATSAKAKAKTPAKATAKAGTTSAKTTAESSKATAADAKRTAASTNGRARRTRRAPAKGRVDVVPAGKLVSLLGTGNGMSTADLTAQTGGDRQQLLTLLRELEAAGQVRRSGERRSTRWHAITDEDRIAERVAQLERQSSRTKRASRAG